VVIRVTKGGAVRGGAKREMKEEMKVEMKEGGVNPRRLLWWQGVGEEGDEVVVATETETGERTKANCSRCHQ
jgi:hypothetical protein